MNILIIEDEAKTAKELRSLIEAIRPDIQVLAILPSIKATVAWLQENEHPQLIFSDIQLADGLSFDIFRQVPVASPIIFCTAFDEYAMRVFDTNGIDYLLKPVDDSKLRQSIQKYESLKKAFQNKDNGYQTKLENLFQQLKPEYKATLLVHYQSKIIPVKTDDISFIHSENSLTILYTEQKKYNIQQPLDELETQLNPQKFFRANRQFILNREAVLNVEHYFTRRLVVRLRQNTPETIIISKVKAPDFLKWLEKG